VMAKRLHDRGRAAWWSGFVLLAIWILCAQANLLLSLPAWFVMGWALIEMGVMPGQPGPNTFGPDPARRVSA
jgi:uncharacterized membrane protein YhaH (DUF805 family)